MRNRSMLLAALIAATSAAGANAAPLGIYADALESGFTDQSWADSGDYDLSNTAPVHAGTASIAFTPNGGLEARTMLTYSQSTDPHSRHYADQTRLYAKKTWVDFPWTSKQIRNQLVRTIHLKG